MMALKKRMRVLVSGGEPIQTMCAGDLFINRPQTIHTYHANTLTGHDLGLGASSAAAIKAERTSGSWLSSFGDGGCILSLWDKLIIKDHFHGARREIKKNSAYEAHGLGTRYGLLVTEASLEVLDLRRGVRARGVRARNVFSMPMEGMVYSVSVLNAGKAHKTGEFWLIAALANRKLQWLDLWLPSAVVSNFSYAPAELDLPYQPAQLEILSTDYQRPRFLSMAANLSIFEGWPLVETPGPHIPERLMALSVRDDRKYAAVGSETGTIYLFGLEPALEVIDILEGHASSITSLLFLDYDLISAGRDGTLRAWDLRELFAKEEKVAVRSPVNTRAIHIAKERA